jgi:CRP/FNR family transcriptional regulator, cyclic AMP receptor protein
MFDPEHGPLSIFEGLAPMEMQQVNSLLEVCSFEPGAVIFEQGQFAAYLYILLKGEVVVQFKPYDGPVLTVAHILPDGVFGWSAALRRSSYTSGAIAGTQIEAARLRGDQLHQLCERRPDIGVVVLERLAGVIAERLCSTHTQIMDLLSNGMELSPENRRR